MANKKFRLGILVMVLIFGMTVVGCGDLFGDLFGSKSNSENGGGGQNSSLDQKLIGQWYVYPSEVGDLEDVIFEITSSGRLISEANTNGEISVTTSRGVIKATVAMNGVTVESGIADYSVTGNKLLLSNPTLNGNYGGLFLPFVSAAEMAQEMGASLGADGYFHKGSGSSGPVTPGNGGGSGGNDGPGPGNGGGSTIGCGSLSSGTKCTAQSGCANKFLCLTGQGNDMDCSTSCSCNG